MVSKSVTITNPTGLHARPASDFVACAKSFESEIYIGRTEDDMVEAKSIVMLLVSGFAQGQTVVIQAQGTDEQEAADALVKLIEDGFHETDGAAG